MGGEIGRAELRGGDGLERLAKAQMRVVAGDRNDIGRLAGERPQRRLDAERAQHLDGVRPELQPGPDLAELCRALVDLDLEAALAQGAGRGEPADARSDHRDARLPGHVAVLGFRSIPELLAQDALVQAVAGIEQHLHRDRCGPSGCRPRGRAHLVVVGDGGDRALLGFEHLDPHARACRAAARRASAAAGTG